MHTVSSPYPRIPNTRLKILFSISSCLNLWLQNPWVQRAYLIEKNLCISGLSQFKPAFFKSQLCLCIKSIKMIFFYFNNLNNFTLFHILVKYLVIQV